MVDILNKIQLAQFELMENFNEFKAECVIGDLKNNMKLWKSVIMTRDEIDIILRDIPKKIWNADTMFILVEDGMEEEMIELTKTWNVDKMNFKNGILALWWD